MWQCDNCGYTDETGDTFEEETEESLEDAVRYCPECGSDEVFMVDEEDEVAVAVDGDTDLGTKPDDDEVDDWAEDEDLEDSHSHEF